MSIAHKRLADATAADVREFVASEPPESDSLELKRTLPARGGDDPWIRGENHIGDRARNELIEEVCAFANAHGGLLLVGVEESADHPKRAAGIEPVPRCQDLAARLRLQIRDCIEPHLASVEVEGIVTSDEGGGVVAIRVPSSALAPHRSTLSRECYVRRADRSERMTMREIQDLTLSRATVGQAIASVLDARSQAFRLDNALHGENLYAMRATGIPTSALSLDKVHGRPELKPSFGAFRARLGGTQVQFYFPCEGYRDRPILRGTRLYADERTIGVSAEVFADGLVEYRWWSTVEAPQDNTLLQEWVAATAMNLLVSCDRVRRVAGAPSQEYGIVFEFHRVGGDLNVGRWGGMRHFHEPAALSPNPIVLPALSLGERAEIPAIVSLLYRDLNNAAGFDVGDYILIPELPEPAAGER